MKLTLETQLTEVETIGNTETVNAGIRTEDLQIILHILSSGFYSNPIGSMIRETASNSYDANKEANSDKPIYINLQMDYEIDKYYIEFKDHGIGISPERWNKVFMNWGASTKRNNNIALGGYGLGSKAFLAYTDIAYITTINNNIKYEYILSKGNPLPESTLLSSTETSKPSGTTIRIYLENNEDWYKVFNEIGKQLCYFDNLYVLGGNFNNDYKLIEGKTFYYNTLNRPSNEVHVVVGCVAYPIDYKQIDITKLNMPFGIKIPIGALDLTPSREGLRYTDKTISVLKDYYTKFIEELNYLVLTNTKKYTDFDEYLVDRDGPTYVILDEVRIPLDKEYFKIDPTFLLLEGIEIPNNPFFDYSYQTLTKGKFGKTTYQLTYGSSTLREAYFADKAIDSYANAYYERGNVITKHGAGYKTYKSYLDLTFDPRFQSKIVTGRRKVGTKLGAAIKIYKYKKFIREYLLSICKSYVRPSSEWIKEYNANLKLQKAEVQRRLNQEVLVKNEDDRRQTIKIATLSKKLLVFYKFLDEELDYKPFYNLTKLYYFDKIMFISIARTNYRYIRDLPNIRRIETFFEEPILINYFHRVHLANYLYNEKGLYNASLSTINSNSKYYSLKIKKLLLFIKEYSNNNLTLEIKDKLKEIYSSKNPRLYEYRMIAKEIIVIKDKVKDLACLNWNAPDYLKAFIIGRSKLTKFNQNLYKWKSQQNS